MAPQESLFGYTGFHIDYSVKSAPFDALLNSAICCHYYCYLFT